MANIKNFVTGNINRANTKDLSKKPQMTNNQMEFTVSQENFKEQFKKYITLFRCNYDLFATWYLGLNLFLYQKIMLNLMSKSTLFMAIASRGISKSFMISIFCVCKAILEPGSIIVIASATRGQSILILKEKIQNELCNMSPNLAREIKNIKVGSNDGIVEFHNGSRIIVATASQNSRGYRSNCNVYEEARMIDEEVLNSVLSPFLISRQAPFLKKPEYSHLKTEPCEIFISSAWYKSLEWFNNLIKNTGNNMIDGKDEQMLASFDYLLSIHHGLKTKKQMEKEKSKSDEISFAIEYENVMYDSAGAFFTYDLFQNSRKIKKALHPLFPEEIASNRKINRLAKGEGVLRILSCDIAMSGGSKNDNSIYTLAELIPMKGYYLRRVSYMESHNGKTAMEQALRIRRLIKELSVDTCVLDCMTIGLPVLDLLGTELVDGETGESYEPICAYNDEDLKARCRVQNAKAMIFGMRASAQLNSDMIVEMKNLFQQDKVEMLISETEADNFLNKTNKQYSSGDSELRAKYELPYIQITACINESIMLETEMKQGKISAKEKGGARKDRFSSLLYLLWVSSEIEKENFKEDDKENNILDYCFLF